MTPQARGESAERPAAVDEERRVTVVVHPDVPFETLDRALAALGWHRDADPTAPPPLIPGEPELASWSRADSDGRATYGFTPGISLRALSFTGSAAAAERDALASRLRTLTISEVRALLDAADAERVLLGILAARELGATELLEPLAELAASPDAAVAREAARSVEALTMALASSGARWLAERRAERPGHSALFPLLGGPADRCQVLRWLIAERPDSDDHLLEVLRSALDDRDLEVRLTAILAAGRLDLRALRSAVYRTPLAAGRREGFDARGRALLLALRDAVVALLDRKLVVASPSEPPSAAEHADPWLHVARCVLGAPVSRHDGTFLLTHALTTPIPDTAPPGRLPAGVVEEDGRWFLAGHDVELVWVPAVPHWLGDDPADEPSALSVQRRDAAGAGFFCARHPLTREAAARLGGWTPSPAPASGMPFATTDLATGRRLCAALSDRIGAVVDLPTSDEWELCARGTDARRYPWGNVLPLDGLPLPSPWGAEEMVGIVPQWTSSTDEGGRPIVRGGARALRCAAREPTRGDRTDVGVRPVLRADPASA